MQRLLKYILMLVVALSGMLQASGQIAMPDNVCVGETKNYWVTETESSSYIWTINGELQTETSHLISVTWNVVPGTYTITVQEESDDGCFGEVQTGQVIVTDGPSVSVTLVASDNPVCFGTGVLLTATPSNGGLNPVLSWFVNGIEQPDIGNTFLYTPDGGDEIYVELISDEYCATGSPATSDVITMEVEDAIVPTIVIAADETTICAGTEVTFTSTITGGGTSPTYQWMVNGIDVAGATNDSWTTTTLVDGDLVSCEVTSDDVCANPLTALSNDITITVTDAIVPTIVIAADETTICAGTEVTFTSTITGGGTAPTYQWMVNGIDVAGATNDSWTSTTLVDGDVVSCELTSDDVCADPLTALSNDITFTVTDAIVPAIVIAADETTICAGTEVNFTSTITGGGTSPAYQWMLNGVDIAGATNDSWTSTTLVDGDVVSCELTSDDVCADPLTALSNDITFTVTDAIVPAIVIAADETTICAGTEVNFTSTITGGGTSPAYQWMLNGVDIAGATNDSWTSTTLVDGDVVSCELTSDDVCANPLTALSNDITFTVTDAIVPTIVIAADETTICAGTEVNFTSTITGGGTAPTYQWMVNGIDVAGATNDSWTSTTLVDGDVVSCELTSDDVCADPLTALSNDITFTVTDAIIPTIVIAADETTICAGTEVTFTSTITGGGTAPIYQWMVNGIDVAGATADTWSSTTLIDGDVVSSQLTSIESCADPLTVTSNEITITVNVESTPIFEQIGILCPNSTAPILPLASLNGIIGTWSPAGINTTIAGTSDYIFTPNVGQCGAEFTMCILVDGPTIINVETTPATNGLSNGKAEIIASGGTLPYQYQVDNSGWQAENTFFGLSVGSHRAYVIDANGCEAQYDFRIFDKIIGEVVLVADDIEQCLNLPIILPVNADNFTEIVSFVIELTFDTDILSYTGLINQNPLLLAAGNFTVSPVGNLLTIRYSADSNYVSIPNGSGLFEIQFNGMAAGYSPIEWNFDECIIYSSDGFEIPKSLVPGAVLVKPTPNISLSAGGIYCADESTQFTVLSHDSQTLNYQWSGPTLNYGADNSLIFEPLKVDDTGTYTLLVSNADQCSISEEVILKVNPSPEISLTETETLCAGTIHYLDAGSGFEDYLWQDGSTLQTYQASDAGTYSVTVANEFGCEGISSVELIPCTLDLEIPNAFTPNGDGRNDTFNPILTGDVVPSRFMMQIFNRWGQLIYATTEYDTGWDGTFNGAEAPQGVYTYSIVFEVPGYVQAIVESPYNGMVTLLR